MNEPKWIAIEGMDGSGKTTQAALLADRLRMAGIRVWSARVPGGCAVGSAVRELLATRTLQPYTEELLIAAAHYEFAVEACRHLALGEWVVSDRATLSARVYSTYGKLNPDLYMMIYTLGRIARSPDLTIVLDLEAESARRRATELGRRAAVSKYDLKPIEFYERIRRHYREAAKNEAVELLHVGDAPVADVTDALWAVLNLQAVSSP